MEVLLVNQISLLTLMKRVLTKAHLAKVRSTKVRRDFLTESCLQGPLIQSFCSSSNSFFNNHLLHLFSFQNPRIVIRLSVQKEEIISFFCLNKRRLFSLQSLKFSFESLEPSILTRKMIVVGSLHVLEERSVLYCWKLKRLV